MLVGAIRCGRLRRPKHGLIATSVLLAVAVVALVYAGAPAYAADDGSNPNDTGCAGSNAWTPHSVSVSDPAGLLELRFSWTCGTAWARFTCRQSGGCTEYRLFVHRDTDGVEYSDSVSLPFSTSNGDQLYTMQLNDGSGVTARACLLNYNFNVPVCTSSY